MEPLEALSKAIDADDAAAAARVIEAQPEVKARLDEPLPGGSFGQTALLAAVQHGNREMMDVLLQAGADINRKSHWWAGGFHVLDDAWREPWMAAFLLGRGAVPEIHHAVRLGMLDEVRRMLFDDPALIRARGGDGQTPLHFAQSVEMADFLLSRGADVNLRDIDHESTAAQWMVRDRQEVARLLVSRGSPSDILMASALGDTGFIARLLDVSPEAIRTSVSNAYFPMTDPRAGGTIYIWTLGAHKTAPLLAREFGQEEAFRLLMANTPDEMKLAVACELGDEDLVKRLLAADPDLAGRLSDNERQRLTYAAQNENVTAVRLMLDAGWPTDVRGRHRATPLHWAGFHGNLAMARLLIERHAAIDVKEDEYDGTPLQWAIHGSVNGWRCKTGDYAGTVEALLAAGAAKPPITGEFRASQAVRAVLERHR